VEGAVFRPCDGWLSSLLPTLGAISMVLTPDSGRGASALFRRKEGRPRACAFARASEAVYIRKAFSRLVGLLLGCWCAGSRLDSSNKTIPADGYLGSRNDEGRSEM